VGGDTPRLAGIRYSGPPENRSGADAEFAGVTLPDGLAAVLEAVIVLGAVALLVQGRSPARSAARSPGVTVATAVLVGVLAVGGVLSQAGANSSSAGPVQNEGGGGPSAPNAPGGGGGSSSGGYSGGY
jgi:hypothetical protein